MNDTYETSGEDEEETSEEIEATKISSPITGVLVFIVVFVLFGGWIYYLTNPAPINDLLGIPNEPLIERTDIELAVLGKKGASEGWVGIQVTVNCDFYFTASGKIGHTRILSYEELINSINRQYQLCVQDADFSTNQMSND